MAEPKTENDEAREYKLTIQALFTAMKLTDELSMAKEDIARLKCIGLKAWDRFYRRRASLPGGGTSRANWEDWAKTRRAA